MKKLIVVGLGLLTVTWAGAALCSQTQHIDAVVKKISPFPVPTSGYMTTWVRVTVVPIHSREMVDMLLTYLSDTQLMPVVGKRCTFNVHHQLAGGFVGQDRVENADSLVIDSFECAP